MKNCPYCDKSFNTWISVRVHLRYCVLKTNEYFIDGNEGPINISEFELGILHLKKKIS